MHPGCRHVGHRAWTDKGLSGFDRRLRPKAVTNRGGWQSSRVTTGTGGQDALFRWLRRRINAELDADVCKAFR